MPTTYDEERPGTKAEPGKRTAQAGPFSGIAKRAIVQDDEEEEVPGCRPDDAWISRCHRKEDSETAEPYLHQYPDDLGLTVTEGFRELLLALAWIQIGCRVLAQEEPVGPDFIDSLPGESGTTEADAEDIGRLLIFTGAVTIARLLSHWSAPLVRPLWLALTIALRDLRNLFTRGRLPQGNSIFNDAWWIWAADQPPSEQDYPPPEPGRSLLADMLMLWSHTSSEVQNYWNNYNTVPRRESRPQTTALMRLGEPQGEHAGEGNVVKLLQEKAGNLEEEIRIFTETSGDANANASVNANVTADAAQPSDSVRTVQISIGQKNGSSTVFEKSVASFENAADGKEPVEVTYELDFIGPDGGLQSAVGNPPQTHNATAGAVRAAEAEQAGQAHALARAEWRVVSSTRKSNPLLTHGKPAGHASYAEASERRWANKTGELHLIHVEFVDSSPYLARFQAHKVNRNGASARTSWQMPVSAAHKEKLLAAARPPAPEQPAQMNLSEDVRPLFLPGLRFFEGQESPVGSVSRGAHSGQAVANVTSDLNEFFAQGATISDAELPASVFSARQADSSESSVRSVGPRTTGAANNGETIPMITFTATGVTMALWRQADVEAPVDEGADDGVQVAARKLVEAAGGGGAIGWIKRNPLRAVAGAAVAAILAVGAAAGIAIAYLSGTGRNDTDDGEATPTESPEASTTEGPSPFDNIQPDDTFVRDVMMADYSMPAASKDDLKVFSLDDYERLHPDNVEYDSIAHLKIFTVNDDVTRLFIEEVWSDDFKFDFSTCTNEGSAGIDVLEANLDLKLTASFVNPEGKTKTLTYGDEESQVSITLIVPVSNTSIKNDLDRQIKALRADVRKVKKFVSFGRRTDSDDQFKYGSFILYPGQKGTIVAMDEHVPMRIWVPVSLDGDDGRTLENNSVNRFYFKTQSFLDSRHMRVTFMDEDYKPKLILTGDAPAVKKLADTLRVLVPRTMLNEQHRFMDVHEEKEKNVDPFTFSLANNRSVLHAMINTLKLYDLKILQADPKIKVPANRETVPFEKRYYTNLQKNAAGLGAKYETYWSRKTDGQSGLNNFGLLTENIRRHFMVSLSQYEYELTQQATELLRLAFLKSLKSGYQSNLQRPNITAEEATMIKNNIARFPDVIVENFNVLGSAFHDIIKFTDRKNKLIVLYFIGADNPFFEFKDEAQLNEWFRGVVSDGDTHEVIKRHIELRSRSERKSKNGETEHGFDYLLEHADDKTDFFQTKPMKIEGGENFFMYFAQAARVRLLNDAHFIQSRSEAMLGNFYVDTGSSGEMHELNMKMVNMVNKNYVELGPQHLKQEHALNREGRALYWLMQVEQSEHPGYAHVSEESVRTVLSEMDLEKEEPDIISIVTRAERIDLKQLLVDMSSRIINGNDCSINKGCLDFLHYKRAVDVVHETLEHGAPSGYTERSMYIEQINRLKDIQTLTTSDNSNKDFRKIDRAAWEMSALAYRDRITADYVYSEKHILDIAADAMGINPLVMKMNALDEGHEHDGERKSIMISIAQMLEVYDDWKHIIDNNFPLLHPHCPSDVAKEDEEPTPDMLQAQVFQSIRTIAGADIRYVRLAENYLRRFRPEMAASASDFTWQLELARQLNDMQTLPDKDEYGVINMAAMDKAASMLLRDKGMKWYAPPTLKDFLEKSLEKTMEDLLEKVYERGQPYWIKQDDGSEIDPSGDVRRVPVDVTPSILTDYSGYTLKLFLHNLDKALENPIGDLSVQLMNVHGDWTEQDKQIAKDIGAAVHKLLELGGYVPLSGNVVAPGLALRPIASSVTKFIKRRVDEGGSFGRQDVKDVATIIWTFIGLKIPNDDYMPINIFGHIVFNEGIGLIPD